MIIINLYGYVNEIEAAAAAWRQYSELHTHTACTQQNNDRVEKYYKSQKSKQQFVFYSYLHTCVHQKTHKIEQHIAEEKKWYVRVLILFHFYLEV